MDGPLSSSRHNHNSRRSRSRSRDHHSRRDHNNMRTDNHRNRRGRDGGVGRDHHHRRNDDRSRERSRSRDNLARSKNNGNGHHNDNGRFRDDRRGNNNNQRDGYNGRDNSRGGHGDFRGDGNNHHRPEHNGQYGPPRDTNHGGGRNNHGRPPRDQDRPPPGDGRGNQNPSPPPSDPRPALLPDERLNQLAEPTPNNEDPRGDDPTKRLTKKAQKVGNGRNTESFDPASTIVRPALRVWVGSNERRMFEKKLKHDDVVIVPELFGNEDDWNIYYKLVEEMRTLQKENIKGSEWISWHEGAHLISKNPKGAPTFEKVIDRLCEYFNIQKKSIGTRFNWYRDSSDWKPFHHDSAAYDPNRAKTQNITVGVSFGAMRELAFLSATPQKNGEKMKLYFPQTNNGVFSFGRDVNILWKHGVNALPEEEQDGKGRISIILWGLAAGVKEEDGSPPLLGSDGKGPHAQRPGDRRGKHNGGHRGRR